MVFFLSKCGLAFRGSLHLMDNSKNENFLGLIELFSKYDALLLEHVEKGRLQVHYRSHDAQNAFINGCGEKVTEKIVSDVSREFGFDQNSTL